MNGIGCIDVSLLMPSSPPPAAQTAGITLFEPGVDGISEDESVVEMNSYYPSPEGGGGGIQAHDATFDYDSDDVPVYVNQPPVSRATAHWINHNTPLLCEYATRQVSPPLSNRVNVEFNHPSQFVTGMMQMLANRDKEGEEDPEPTRRTPPQLLEGFVDLDRWAKEYSRTQFGLERLGDGVPNLLTIIANNFYEAHMHLMDAIMKKAISNMEIRRGPYLEAGDFNFGFDLRMTQEMPFLVNSRHRVRETLDHLHSASKLSTTRPSEGVSRYGRRSKPTAGARQAAVSREEPPRVQPKQIMPKPPRIVTKPVPPVSSPGVDAAKVPVADDFSKKGRSRKPKADVKVPLVQDDPSVAASSRARQPLGETSLTNTAPPEGAGGGKTLAHLALIKHHAPAPASTSRQDTRPFGQRLPKIIIKPLTHVPSKMSVPKGSAPGNTLTVDITSKDTTDAIDLECDTAGVPAISDTVAPQGPPAVGSIPLISDPSPRGAVPSSETSQNVNSVSLKRKREYSVENRLS